MSPHAPPEPPLIEEYMLAWLLRRALFRDVIPEPPTHPPDDLAPWEQLRIDRPHEEGPLDAVLFPVEDARGLVVLAPPGAPEGKAWFWRGPRIPALREAGWSVLAFDWNGFGGSPPTRRLGHVDALDVLLWARKRWARVHWWGVGIGGYWPHLALTRPHAPAVGALVWEDAIADLLRYGFPKERQRRIARAIRRRLPNAAAFLPAVAHCAYLPIDRAFYVGGAEDQRAGPWSAPDLTAATLTGAPKVEGYLVQGARHLECLKKDARVLRKGLETLDRAAAPTGP